MKYLVMDFGGTFVKYSVMDEDCQVYLREEQVAPAESKEAFLSFIVETYERVSKDDEIGGVAISMPGVLNGETGYVQTAGAYSHLYEMDLAKDLGSRLPVPFSVENDGKCGALAELWRGNLAGCKDGVVLILGTGIAGGVIVDGKIQRGKSLKAGEFSYYLIGTEFLDMAIFHCGVAAMLYKAMLGKGIDVKKSPHHWLLSPFLGENDFLSEADKDPAFEKGMDGYQFFSLLEQGDEAVSAVYDSFLDHMVNMIFNLQLTTAPEKILVGGGISRQERLLPDLRAAYAKLEEEKAKFFPVPCHLERCAFGNEANQYGALYHFLQKEGKL